MKKATIRRKNKTNGKENERRHKKRCNNEEVKLFSPQNKRTKSEDVVTNQMRENGKEEEEKKEGEEENKDNVKWPSDSEESEVEFSDDDDDGIISQPCTRCSRIGICKRDHRCVRCSKRYCPYFELQGYYNSYVVPDRLRPPLDMLRISTFVSMAEERYMCVECCGHDFTGFYSPIGIVNSDDYTRGRQKLKCVKCEGNLDYDNELFKLYMNSEHSLDPDGVRITIARSDIFEQRNYDKLNETCQQLYQQFVKDKEAEFVCGVCADRGYFGPINSYKIPRIDGIAHALFDLPKHQVPKFFVPR